MSDPSADIVAADSTTVCEETAVTGATGLAVAVAGPVPVALLAATVMLYSTAAWVKSVAGRLTGVLAAMLAKRAPGYTGLGFPDPRKIALTPSARTGT